MKLFLILYPGEYFAVRISPKMYKVQETRLFFDLGVSDALIIFRIDKKVKLPIKDLKAFETTTEILKLTPDKILARWN